VVGERFIELLRLDMHFQEPWMRPLEALGLYLLFLGIHLFLRDLPCRAIGSLDSSSEECHFAVGH
jgi:hypothetical protein